MAAIIGKGKYPTSQKDAQNEVGSFSFFWRINFLAFFIFAISGVIFFRLYFLQIVSHASFADLSQNQHNIFRKLVPERGEIYFKDKNGIYPAAVNKETKLAYAVPKEIRDGEVGRTADKIVEILSLDKADVLEKFERRESMYAVLKRRLSQEEIEKIREAELSGIHLADESYRYYPSAELAAQVIGFVGWSGNVFGGRYGAEAFFEDKLKGREGNIFQSRDSRGSWITVGERKIMEAENGESLILSIDHIVQYETERIIKSAVERFDAEDGLAIVMETKTGRILASADYPSFDPNKYAEAPDFSVYKNSLVSDTYECGSVFKPFTMAAGLDSNKVSADTTYIDTGAVKEAGYTIKNSDLKAYGRQTMTEVLEKSLNTGVIFVEKLLGNKNFYDYAKRFGFGEPTYVGLPGESGGNIKNLENLKSNIQFFTASFGQGIAVTPIQLISAFNALANRGVLMKPQIVEKIIGADGSEEEVMPEEVRRVISEKASIQISDMLRSVVVNGHGKQAGVPGYLVGGKTGTAQVASSSVKGYEEGKTMGSFAGYAPLNDPRFTVLVKITNPKNVQWAESSAAPTFGELMKFLLEYYNVEPTEEYSQQDLDVWNRTHTLRESLKIKEEEERKKNKENMEKERKENEEKNENEQAG
jgi:cell division protein FtsI/penicillin-binding protein 2